MANHKRGRPKQRRAGCLLCKPHKLSSLKKAERGVAVVARFSMSCAPRRSRLGGRQPAIPQFGKAVMAKVEGTVS